MKMRHLFALLAVALLLQFSKAQAQPSFADYQYVARINLVVTLNETNQFEKFVIDTQDLLELVAEEVGYTNSISNLELVVSLFSPEEVFLYVVDKRTGLVISEFSEFFMGGFSTITKESVDQILIKVLFDAYIFDTVLGNVGAFLDDYYIGQAYGKIRFLLTEGSARPTAFMTALIQGALYGEEPLPMIQGTIFTLRRFQATDPVILTP